MLAVAESFGFGNDGAGGTRTLLLDPKSLDQIREKAKSNVVKTS